MNTSSINGTKPAPLQGIYSYPNPAYTDQRFLSGREMEKKKVKNDKKLIT